MGLSDRGLFRKYYGLINKEIFHMSDTYSLTIEHDEDAFYVLMIVLAIDAQKCSRNK